jgi:ABC-type uncharacterized transport system ATPase subunit
MASLLRMENMVKAFGDKRAVDDVSFELKKGEIHALLGENGAGKSTLMNMLYGLLRPTSGHIVLNGSLVDIDSPLKAIQLGIGMVHQHFMLIPAFTVFENIVLGTPSSRAPFLDKFDGRKRILEIAEKNSLNIDLDARVADISVGLQQQVEIIKALYRGAEILILDEPTGVLTPKEIVDLFSTLRELAKSGLSIIFISHKLDEVMAISDRATVLRDGKLVRTLNTKLSDQHELARCMVGRDVIFRVERTASTYGQSILDVQKLCVNSGSKASTLKDISFSLHSGEIMGVAGIDGNGQSELVQAITGLCRIDGGQISFLGENITNLESRVIERMGMALIPEDRKQVGIVRNYGIDMNLILRRQERSPFCKNYILSDNAIKEHADRVMAEYDIRAINRHTAANYLSGGNMQKLILAREIEAKPHLLIAMHPTRGLDVGAIEFIHSRIIQEREKGMAILIVSTELEEIMTLADRIMVLYEGAVKAILDRDDATYEKIGFLMGGGSLLSVAEELLIC